MIVRIFKKAVLVGHTDVTTGSLAFFFHLCKVGTFVPVGLEVVVVRHGVEPWCFYEPLGNDGIRNTHDRRRINASAEFSEDGTVGTKPPPNGLYEHIAEVLLVFGICLVADALPWVKVPIPADDALVVTYEHVSA